MATQPAMGCSVPSMVERYLGSEYDTVKLVADNITSIVQMAAALNAGSYFQLPVGTTTERPTNPVNGMIRFNSDVPRFEGYNNGWGVIGGGDAEVKLGFTLAARLTADGTSLVYDFGEGIYVDETTLFIFTDTSWQRPITDYTIGANGTSNQGKLVFKSAPPEGTVIDVVRFTDTSVITDGAKVTFASTVPDAANSTPWFVNLSTGKTYFAVQGENASYWVEQNSNGEL